MAFTDRGNVFLPMLWSWHLLKSVGGGGASADPVGNSGTWGVPKHVSFAFLVGRLGRPSFVPYCCLNAFFGREKQDECAATMRALSWVVIFKCWWCDLENSDDFYVGDGSKPKKNTFWASYFRVPSGYQGLTHPHMFLKYGRSFRRTGSRVFSPKSPVGSTLLW